jgi:hypothetical protein
MGFFDDILKTSVTDETDRTSLATLAAKYPNLIKAVDETDTAASGWEKWRNDHWDPTANKTKEQVAAEQRVAALEAVGNFGGAEMTFEEIKASLAKEGFVAKADLVSAMKNRADPLHETVRGMVNGSAAGIEFFLRKMGSVPVEHFKEFGEVDPKLMDTIIDAYGKAPAGTDPRTVYDQIVAPKRDEIRKAAETARETQHKADLEAAEARGAAKARQEIGMAAGSAGMPTDQSGSPAGMGPLQRQQAERFNATKETAPPNSAPLGSGINAREGLQWLQEQRSSGGVQ